MQLADYARGTAQLQVPLIVMLIDWVSTRPSAKMVVYRKKQLMTGSIKLYSLATSSTCNTSPSELDVTHVAVSGNSSYRRHASLIETDVPGKLWNGINNNAWRVLHMRAFWSQ